MYKYLKRTNALDTYLTQGINNNATIFFSIEREIKIQQIGTWHKNFNEVVNYLNSFIINSDCAKHGLVNLGKNSRIREYTIMNHREVYRNRKCILLRPIGTY